MASQQQTTSVPAGSRLAARFDFQQGTFTGIRWQRGDAESIDVVDPVPATQAPVAPSRRTVLDAARFRLAHRISTRLEGQDTADPATLRAVEVLTAATDPDRAERLRPRAGEPAALVGQLAVWALFGADDLAVAAAGRVLDGAERDAASDQVVAMRTAA